MNTEEEMCVIDGLVTLDFVLRFVNPYVLKVNGAFIV